MVKPKAKKERYAIGNIGLIVAIILALLITIPNLRNGLAYAAGVFIGTFIVFSLIIYCLGWIWWKIK